MNQHQVILQAQEQQKAILAEAEQRRLAHLAPQYGWRSRIIGVLLAFAKWIDAKDARLRQQTASQAVKQHKLGC
jgi:hypothetical protein